VRNTSYRVKGEHFDRREGLPGVPTQMHPLPTAIEGTDGRLWFALQNGVVWLDPATYSEHRVAPPAIAIESVSADDKGYAPASSLSFPAPTSSVQIGYAAVSLSDPEAIRFRYKLQETGEDWHEVASASPVTYRNLPPGSYHFNVTASDTNGIWSNKVAAADFTILPAFYQTPWFRSLCAITFVALLAGLYQLRLKHLRRQYSVRLEERVNERTRIARELHDTLLQSFHGLLLHIQTAYNHLPSRPENARKALGVALDRGAEAIMAARATVQELRSTPAVTNELSSAIAALSEELRAAPAEGRSPAVEVEVEGQARELQPIQRDEIYRITGEALRNAFRHAQAARIDVAIRHGDHEFRITVKDDGKGIDPEILQQGGRRDHWGLPGMRERAEAMGAELDVWSSTGNGTEVSLRVPAVIAYVGSATRRQNRRDRTGRVANDRD
jgi:signal transduction histidine kinase